MGKVQHHSIAASLPGLSAALPVSRGLFLCLNSPPMAVLPKAAFYSLTAALNISRIRSSAKLCASGQIARRSLGCQLQSASQVGDLPPSWVSKHQLIFIKHLQHQVEILLLHVTN